VTQEISKERETCEVLEKADVLNILGRDLLHLFDIPNALSSRF